MVAVKVTDENMVNAVEAYLLPDHAQLGSFSTIHKKQILIVVYHLGSVVPAEGKRC
jgi:hypothetical protein